MVDTLHLRTWESKTALLAHLKAHGSRGLVIGSDAEAPRAYYSCSIDHGGGHGEIAIISSGLGGSPAAVVMDQERRALIGHDTSITCVDVSAMSIVTSLSLGGVFFEFLPVDRRDEIVVLHEIGVLRIDANATMKWSVDCDVIEDFVVDDQGRLVLSAMDGARLAISLRSGVVSR